MLITRRAALKGALATAIGALTGAVSYGVAYERHRVGVTEATMPFFGLSPALDGLRVALLTDVHHSALVSADDVTRAVELALSTQPDMIVLGGDYVTFGDRNFVEPVAELLAPLRAPNGVFAILGNHDDDREMPAALTRKGITVLKDQRTRVVIRGDALEIAGIRFWTRRPADIAKVLKGADDPVLLLAHDPRRLDRGGCAQCSRGALRSYARRPGRACPAWAPLRARGSPSSRDWASARTRRSSSVVESARFTCRCESTVRRKSRSSHCSGSRRPDHATAFDPPSAIEHERNRLGIRVMFLDEDPRRQRLLRIVVKHGHSALNDDRTRVEVRRDEVHGHAARFDAVIEGLLLRVKTGKRRQK